MRIRTSTKDLSKLEADVTACFAFEGDVEPSGVDDDLLRREIAAEMRVEKFKGRPTDVVVWNANGRFGSRRFVVVGLGKRREEVANAVRRGAAMAARSAAGLRARRLALRLPPSDGAQGPEETRAAVEGVLLGAYHFDRYLTDPDFKPEKLTALEISSDGPPSATRRGAGVGEVVGKAVRLARDLVNEPPSYMNPLEMTRRARAVARSSGLTVHVMARKEIERHGMGALLAVSRGSAVEPRVVRLSYRPAKSRARRRKVVLVGKGVTFDSGGLNIKPTASMGDMKSDMAGAAAVVATMSALRDVGCKAEVHGLIGLVENLTGGDAYKPGDILRTYLGKTVEVTNTDAEGRLVLADLLAYAARVLEPDVMVDLATLTGACVVALGTQASGLFVRDDELAGAILDAGARAGEKIWRMPMYEEYLDGMQGGPADLRNAGDRWGGAITAALFLGEFVPRELPWAHLDIAGPAFASKQTSDSPAGGTGAGVRTVVRWLETL